MRSESSTGDQGWGTLCRDARIEQGFWRHHHSFEERTWKSNGGNGGVGTSSSRKVIWEAPGKRSCWGHARPAAHCFLLYVRCPASRHHHHQMHAQYVATDTASSSWLNSNPTAFCRECVDIRVQTRQRKCPHCNLPFGQADVHNIFFNWLILAIVFIICIITSFETIYLYLT